MSKLVTHIRGSHGPACSTHTRTLRASEMVDVLAFEFASNRCTRCEKRFSTLLRMALKRSENKL